MLLGLLLKGVVWFCGRASLAAPRRSSLQTPSRSVWWLPWAQALFRALDCCHCPEQGHRQTPKAENE
jgi:hypothetical protein